MEFVRFQSTLWSRISLVKRNDSNAVAEFVTRYREPVLRFVRNAGFPEQDAEDLTQDVFARLLADEVLTKADRDRGRFRSFLLGVTKNVIQEERRKRRAAKRGGEQRPLSLDADNVEEPGADPPEDEFDRAWVGNLLSACLEALERENADHYRALSSLIIEEKDYRQIAAEMGRPLQHVKNYIHRARLRLMDLLQREISRYSSSAVEYEEEIKYLSRFLK